MGHIVDFLPQIVVFQLNSDIWSLMVTTLFKINEKGFLLTLLDSGETMGGVFFHPKNFNTALSETAKLQLNRIPLKTH